MPDSPHPKDPRPLHATHPGGAVHVSLPDLTRALCGVVYSDPEQLTDGAGTATCLVCRNNQAKPACPTCWRPVGVRVNGSARAHPDSHQPVCPGTGRTARIPAAVVVPRQRDGAPERLRAGGPGWGRRSLAELGGIPETHVDSVMVAHLVDSPHRRPTRTPTRGERRAALRVLVLRGAVPNETLVALGISGEQVAAARQELGLELADA